MKEKRCRKELNSAVLPDSDSIRVFPYEREPVLPRTSWLQENRALHAVRVQVWALVRHDLDGEDDWRTRRIS